jgi:hypothetical protein
MWTFFLLCNGALASYPR